MSAIAVPPVGASAERVEERAAPKRPQPRIEVAPCDPAAVERLCETLGISRTFAQVLVRRGLAEPEAARAFLNADERHDPRAFAGIEDAIALILRHLLDGSAITVHGDYDVDGVCATAVLVRALRRLSDRPELVGWFLPSRVDDGYGLAAATVERLAERGTRLLITVDCAITAVDEVALARRRGIDVVVTDHHRPRADGALPEAPIVHPALGGYPCPDLCAAGVAYKLAQALALAAADHPGLATRAGAGAAGTAAADDDLDLVALATVADLVPLKGENRRLVRAGLRTLASTAKPGLRALMRVARIDPSAVDAGAVGYRLAPRINAAGRLHRADAGLELLLTDDEERAAAVADELDRANAERRFAEQRILWEAEAQIHALGDRPAYVLAGEGWHPGVIGIVASRVVERYHRPAILIALPQADGRRGPRGGHADRRPAILTALPEGDGPQTTDGQVEAAHPSTLTAGDGADIRSEAAPLSAAASNAAPQADDAAAVTATTPGERPLATGSGRSIPGFDLLAALHAAAPLLERYGGHTAAAGLTVDPARVDELRAAIEAHAAAALTPDQLVPVERVDAVVGARQLGLALADELARLEPTGIGNPAVNLLVAAATFDDARTMGADGQHVRFSVEAGGGRCRAVAFGCDGRLPVPVGALADATFRLERNTFNGAVEPRLRLRHARPTAPPPIEVVGEPTSGGWLTTVIAEAERAVGALPAGGSDGGGQRNGDPGHQPEGEAGASAAGGAGKRDDDRGGQPDTQGGGVEPGLPPVGDGDPGGQPDIRKGGVAFGARATIDRRADGAVAVLRDLVAQGARVLAVCAHLSRRLPGLQARVGGFALASHAALARDPALIDAYDHVVVLDPPTHPTEADRLRRGSPGSFAYRTWGAAELRFTQQIHESEHDLRAQLVPFYRALRERGRAAGEELEALLRGDGPHSRTVEQAARMVAILTELGLVSLDRDLPALTVRAAERTALDRSATWRATMQHYEDGRRWLKAIATETAPAGAALPWAGA